LGTTTGSAFGGTMTGAGYVFCAFSCLTSVYWLVESLDVVVD